MASSWRQCLQKTVWEGWSSGGTSVDLAGGEDGDPKGAGTVQDKIGTIQTILLQRELAEGF